MTTVDVAGAHVAIVTTSFPASPGDPSGHFVASHAAALAQAFDRVTVLAPVAPRQALPPRVRVVPVGGASLFSWPGAVARTRRAPWRALALLGFVARARAALSQERPDTIVAHWGVPSAFPVCDGLDGRLDVWWHGADVRLLTGAPGMASNAVLERIVSRAHRMIFVADALRRALRRCVPLALRTRFDAISRVSPAPIEVLPVDALPPLTVRGARSTPYVVWCGRDVADKRLSLAIAATARARVPLVVVGATRANRDGDAHVEYVGTVTRPESLSAIAGASVLLSTSAAEGAPTVVREARAYGVPVVATDAGDLRAWARVDDGITMVAPDAGSLADALIARCAARND